MNYTVIDYKTTNSKRASANVLIVIIIILMGVTGCKSNEEVEELSEIPATLEFEIDIKSGEDKYSLLMSSVPGLPVEISTKVYTNNLNLGLLVTCSYGEVRLWNEDGSIT